MVTFVTDEEKILISQIQKGDAAAFEKLYGCYYTNIFRFIYSIVKEFEIAEDLVQDVFINVWKQRAQINVEQSIKSYLFTAARNASLNYLRHRSVVRKIFPVSVKIDEQQKININLNQGEELYSQKTLQEELQQALSSLPDKCRTVFYLSRYEELTHNQIAEILDISPKTVNNQILKALKILRKRLKHLI